MPLTAPSSSPSCSRCSRGIRVRARNGKPASGAVARCGRALGHPNVVAVKRAGWWDGVPYLVEEFVPQGSLAAQLGNRPSPVRQALGLVEQLAEIVCYVHRQGMVHGNLKPSNVLFAADGIPRIVDFRPPVGLIPIPLPADGDDPGRRRVSRAGDGRRAPHRRTASHGYLRPGSDPVPIARGTAAVRRQDGGGGAGAGSRIRTASTITVQPRGDTTSGGVLPSLPEEESMAALPPHLRRTQANCGSSRSTPKGTRRASAGFRDRRIRGE